MLHTLRHLLTLLLLLVLQNGIGDIGIENDFHGEHGIMRLDLSLRMLINLSVSRIHLLQIFPVKDVAQI